MTVVSILPFVVTVLLAVDSVTIGSAAIAKLVNMLSARSTVGIIKDFVTITPLSLCFDLLFVIIYKSFPLQIGFFVI